MGNAGWRVNRWGEMLMEDCVLVQNYKNEVTVSRISRFLDFELRFSVQNNGIKASVDKTVASILAENAGKGFSVYLRGNSAVLEESLPKQVDFWTL